MPRLDDFGARRFAPLVFDGAQSARRVSTGTGAGYTVFVRLLKVLLPLGALVIVGVVFARLSASPLREVEIAASAKNDKAAAGAVEVVGARYEGADEKGRPYTLIADRARRAEDSGQPNDLTGGTVLFDGVKADIFLEDKSWLSVGAKTGSYDLKGQRLELSGDVEIFHDSGYEMHLDRLAVELKTRHAVSKTPVHAQGALGEIAAQGMEVADEGNRVVFAGPVKLTLHRLGRKG